MKRAESIKKSSSLFQQLVDLCAEQPTEEGEVDSSRDIEAYDKDFIVPLDDTVIDSTLRGFMKSSSLVFDVMPLIQAGDGHPNEVTLYKNMLRDKGFELVSIPPDGSCFYHAMALGIEKLLPQVLGYPQDGDSLRALVYSAIISSTEEQLRELRERFGNLIISDIWDTVKRLPYGEAWVGLFNVPEEIRNRLDVAQQCYQNADDEEKSEIDAKIGTWATDQGAADYIAGIGTGVTYGGLVEAGILCELFDGLSIKIHKVEDRIPGYTVAVGREDVPEEAQVHLLQTRNHYDLLWHPGQAGAKETNQ